MPKRVSIYLPGMAHGSPISTATRVGPLLISGLIRGRDLTTNDLPGDPIRQAELLMENIGAVLQAAGGSLDDIVKVRVWVKDRTVREFLNPVWEQTFPDKDNRPSRHVYEQKLGMESAYYEAEVVAYIE